MMIGGLELDDWTIGRLEIGGWIGKRRKTRVGGKIGDWSWIFEIRDKKLISFGECFAPHLCLLLSGRVLKVLITNDFEPLQFLRFFW